jgi:hypothetical protein
VKLTPREIPENVLDAHVQSRAAMPNEGDGEARGSRWLSGEGTMRQGLPLDPDASGLSEGSHWELDRPDRKGGDLIRADGGRRNSDPSE